MQKVGRLLLASSFAAIAAVSTLRFATATDASIDAELDQNWDVQKRIDWEIAPQGSRLIPLTWLKALEQPSSEGMLLAADHMARFRYLPPTKVSPHGLPVGFAIDESDDKRYVRTNLSWSTSPGTDKRWVGMTCAACNYLFEIFTLSSR